MSNEQRYSVGFSEFRNLMDLWDNYVISENIENEIKKFLDHKNFIMFFLYPMLKGNHTEDTKLYGSTEMERVKFATLKNPDVNELEPKIEEFSGYDLNSMFKSNSGDDTDDVTKLKLFNKKDLRKIKVISQAKALKILKTKKIKSSVQPMPNDEKPKKLLNDD